MKPNYKYIHYFSINFAMPSNIDPDEAEKNEDVRSKLNEDMETWVLDVIKYGCYEIDWYDSEDD